MLVELRVRNLGVIEDTRVELGPGMIAITGETGAGKTLVVEALELLTGGRADPSLVRPGAAEALIEGRFERAQGSEPADEADRPDRLQEEVILSRSLAPAGRSRAWVDGRMAQVSGLARAGSVLVELYGQNAQMSLLDASAQRGALDAFAGTDLSPLQQARERLGAIDRDLEALGGDSRAQAREADLIGYQVDEIDRAALEGPDEDEMLEAEEERLADAAALRQIASRALAMLGSYGEEQTGLPTNVGGTLSDVIGALASYGALEAVTKRLSSVQAELSDVCSELRRITEEWEEDPERLSEVRTRRQLLRELRRKYGETLAEVIAYREEAARRLSEIESAHERVSALHVERASAQEQLERATEAVHMARVDSAPKLAGAVQARLRKLAMPRARLEVIVKRSPPRDEAGASTSGDEVTIMLGANPGEPVLPLSKVASGGELARTMLALRLVLSGAPETMVFDEVDAGIGGETATEVGRSLAELARNHQVLVVTHLAQVAAFADQQLGVRKRTSAGRTVASVTELDGEDRIVELARMLSGRPDSETARLHAEELLREAAPPGGFGRRCSSC